jgi:hypothetical protein
MTTADEWYRMGLALHGERRWGAAAGCFARVGGGDHLALTNLGWNRHLAGRTEEAAGVLAEAAAKGPRDGVAAALLGQCWLTLGGDELALSWAREAVVEAPESAIAHVALGFALFFNGDWAAGFREFEWRYQYRPEMYPPRPQALWRGEVVDRLWVEAEQGFGDTIFCLRWLAEARERVGSLMLFVQPELYSWIREWNEIRSSGGIRGIEIMPLPRPVPVADAWCPMMSLPAALGVGDPPPWPIRYQGVKFIPDVPTLPLKRIGICWRGNPAHEQAHHRDLPLAYWLPLLENGEVEWHSVQQGGTGELAPLGVLPLLNDRAPEITNFADSARILGELDLLITVDTALAHLAGALGKPVWLILNQRGQDWRWGRGETTGWYPSIRLMRRSLDEDWAAVMARVDRELRG